MTTRVAILALLTLGCKGSEKPKAVEAPTPVTTRIDAVGLELDLLPTWMPGGPTNPGPNEASYYRGSAAAPDAVLFIVNTDMDLSSADDERLLFLSKTVAGQIVRAGGTCEVAPLGGRKVGRCQVDHRPLAKLSYTVPVGSRSYNLLFQWQGSGPSLAGEADLIVASLQPEK